MSFLLLPRSILIFCLPLFTLTQAVTVPSDCRSLEARIGKDSGLVPTPKGLTRQLGDPW